MALLDFMAKISLDDNEFLRGMNSAESKLNALKTVGKVALAGLGAAAAGVTAVVKSSVDAYADYEQLVGGVETLFGDSAEKVVKDAEAAFKTAGMSMNDYMETSIQSAASLINSLGGDQAKAADLMNMSITDMSDNVNKMGTSMESIQDAYRGFSRGNFTMLDNLALGFAGTKDGMQELLDKAQEFSGIEYDIDSYADIVQAIHVVQEEMGITGTTAKEAASTISGSANSMKAAWQNMLVGVADDSADFESLIGNLVDSVGAFAGNIMPRISTALQGVGKLVTALAPQIAAAIPVLISDVLPALTQSAATLVMSLGQGLIENLPTLMDAATQVVLFLAQGISDNLPTLIPTIVDVVLQIVDTLIDNVDMLIEAALQITIALAEGLIASLPHLLQKAPEIIASLVSAIIGAVGQLGKAAGSIISTLASGIASRFSTIIGKGRELLQAFKSGVVSAVGSLASAGLNLVQGIWNGISSGLGWIKSKIQGWVGNVTSFIKSLFGIHSPSTVMRDQVGKFLALGIGIGFEKEMRNVEDQMKDAMPDLGEFLDDADFESALGMDGIDDEYSIETADSKTNEVARSREREYNELVKILKELQDDIQNMKIILDSGVLVGVVSKGLGEDYNNTKRRVFA